MKFSKVNNKYQNLDRIDTELSLHFSFLINLIWFNLQSVNLKFEVMKKIIYLLSVLILVAITFNLTITVKHFNNNSSMTLQNIEALSYAETINKNCVGVGSLDCPNSNFKVKLVY